MPKSYKYSYFFRHYLEKKDVGSLLVRVKRDDFPFMVKAKPTIRQEVLAVAFCSSSMGQSLEEPGMGVHKPGPCLLLPVAYWAIMELPCPSLFSLAKAR